MKRIGRNDACPCGSGKKYKKCCLGKEVQPGPAETTEPSSPQQWGISAREVVRLGALQHLDMRPYTCLKLAEGSVARSQDPEQARAHALREKEGLTRSAMAALGTEAIEQRLRDFGVPYLRDRFLKECRECRSAWSISARWFADHTVSCLGWEADFLGLASCELWRRLLPEHPSIEMIDDFIEIGYEHRRERRLSQACQSWSQAWQALEACLPESATSLEAADEFFNGTQFVSNWLHDYQDALHNTSLKEPAFCAKGASFCRAWLDRFVDEPGESRIIFHHALAEFTLRHGEIEKAEALLQEMVENWPDNPWAYIYHADACSHLFAHPQNHLRFEPERARQFLQQAAEVAQEDYEFAAVEERQKALALAQPRSELCDCCHSRVEV